MGGEHLRSALDGTAPAVDGRSQAFSATLCSLRSVVVRINLDMDVLRTFVAGFELGNFARAAERLGRSQSAISTQLRKLEDQIGERLVQNSGRGLVLTSAGETLFGYAKRILELNDEAADSIRGAQIEGWARLGLPQDFADGWLPSILTRFSQAHPKVRVEVHVDRSTPLIEKARKGELDLALAWDDARQTPHGQHVADLPMHWIGRAEDPAMASFAGETVPLAALMPPCLFRSAGIAALDGAGLPWRLAFTSPSVSGLWAAAEAGLGITVRTAINMPKALGILEPSRMGLPVLPTVPLSLHRAEAEPASAIRRLTDILLETIQDHTDATNP